jgi:hypothetical protein
MLMTAILFYLKNVGDSSLIVCKLVLVLKYGLARQDLDELSDKIIKMFMKSWRNFMNFGGVLAIFPLSLLTSYDRASKYYWQHLIHSLETGNQILTDVLSTLNLVKYILIFST